MGKHWRRVGSVLTIVLLTAVSPAPVAAQPAAEGAAEGQAALWMLRNYRVPGCEPMPELPVVFDWLIRKALAVREFLAVSVDCGQVGRRGAREGWTYVFWVEREDTAIGRLVQKAGEKYGLTQLVPRRAGESWTERARAHEPFMLIQLAGEEGPVRVWATGYGKLEVVISVVEEGQFQIEARSVTHDGQTCTSTRRLTAPAGPRQREALPCRASG